MLSVSDTASSELKKVLATDSAKSKQLVIYFHGYGWSGPSLGMTLEESVDGLEKIENNEIVAYVDATLVTMLNGKDKINIDYINQGGRHGYSITIGDGCSPDSCSSGGCGWFNDRWLLFLKMIVVCLDKKILTHI